MPKIKTVSVHFGYKRNMGDYESANVECTLWADLEDGEDLDQTMHGLWEMAKTNVRANLPQKNGNGSLNVKEAFLGLPVELQQAAGLDPKSGMPYGDK